jgi:hypothetical protein
MMSGEMVLVSLDKSQAMPAQLAEQMATNWPRPSNPRAWHFVLATANPISVRENNCNNWLINAAYSMHGGSLASAGLVLAEPISASEAFTAILTLRFLQMFALC